MPFAKMTEAAASIGKPRGKSGLASPPVFATARRYVRKLNENCAKLLWFTGDVRKANSPQRRRNATV
jgi:hypothetical protein